MQRSCFAAYPSISSGFGFSIAFFCRIFPTKGAEEVGTLSHFSGIASEGGAIMVCTTGTESFHAIHGRFLELKWQYVALPLITASQGPLR